MRFFFLFIFFLWLAVFGLESCGAEGGKIVWYQKGSVLPKLVLPDQAKGNEQKAAQLFQKMFHTMTGEVIPIRKEGSLSPADSQHLVLIGNTKAMQKARMKQMHQDGFQILFQKTNLYFFAAQNVNLLYAVNRFFESKLEASYMEAKELRIPSRTQVSMEEFALQEEPAFAFRQAYFPASEDYDYMNFHGLHRFEEIWAVWGHNLQKILKADPQSQGNASEIFALQGGSRNPVQYCFSSERLYQVLERGIQQLVQEKSDFTYYSIAPNDNGLVCTCAQCTASNHGTASATNSVSKLVNRLAKRFPQLMFTTLAYASTKEAGEIPLASNAVVILSTIEEPKGIPIATSARFSKQLQAWKKNCSRIYIWDYTVQYTNYNDPFPNLPALQRDLQYFKQQGVQGVFEHGSEEHYGLFGDLKSFVIAQWLWNPQQNYDSLKQIFYATAYPTSGKAILQFLQTIESKQQLKIPLDIYGNIMQQGNAYVSAAELEEINHNINEVYNVAGVAEKRKLKTMQYALAYNLLEVKRLHGYDPLGCFLRSGDDYILQPEVERLLAVLHDAEGVYTETGEDFNRYRSMWKDYIMHNQGSNVAAGKAVQLSAASDNFSGTELPQALTNGIFGFHDYASGYLIYYFKPVQITLHASDFKSAENLRWSFLQSPKHHLYPPSKISWSGVTATGQEVLLGNKGTENLDPEWTGKTEVQLPLDFKTYKTIIIQAYPQPETRVTDGSNKLPGIACDEVIIQ